LTPSIDDDDDGIVVDDDARGKCGGLNTGSLERRLGHRRSEPYSNGVRRLPTCGEAPPVAASCCELWREKGKNRAKW
jgi:hypothetical protein